MIDSIQIQVITEKYKVACLASGRSPTFRGLARLLGCDPKTIHNVVTGFYNGHRYGDIPSIRRCIANDDFEVVRGLYGC